MAAGEREEGRWRWLSGSEMRERKEATVGGRKEAGGGSRREEGGGRRERGREEAVVAAVSGEKTRGTEG